MTLPAHHDIEPVLDARRGEVEFGEVCYQPGRAGVVVFGSGDQHRVDVDAHDLVAGVCEMATDPARPTAGVEHSECRLSMASMKRASPPRSSPAAAIDRNRSTYHEECPGFRSVDPPVERHLTEHSTAGTVQPLTPLGLAKGTNVSLCPSLGRLNL